MSRVVRTVAATLAACALTLGATACSPEPAATPSASATGFTDEAEAFAAAEATYRAYVDAVNERRRDPESTPDPQSFLTGAALEEEIATQRELKSRNLTIKGDSAVLSISLKEVTEAEVTLLVCLDASEGRVFDSSGSDVTPSNRTEVLGLDVKVLADTQPMLIAESNASDASC
jgi:hypothetical protein